MNSIAFGHYVSDFQNIFPANNHHHTPLSTESKTKIYDLRNDSNAEVMTELNSKWGK